MIFSMKNSHSDKNTESIHLEPHNPDWSKMFAMEAERLYRVLDPDIVVDIQHFGSTSIPGLSAKPIIDILIGVTSLSDAKKFIPILEKMGYAYWSEDPRPDGYFLVKGLPPNGPRTHHVHITEIGSDRWQRLLFRDYLRTHPKEMKRYEKLKIELSKKYKIDREVYTAAKTEYVQSVMEKAKKEVLNR